MRAGVITMAAERKLTEREKLHAIIQAIAASAFVSAGWVPRAMASGHDRTPPVEDDRWLDVLSWFATKVIENAEAAVD